MSEKKELTPEQRRNAAKASNVLDDVRSELAVSFAGTTFAWASLAQWHVSVPFLPVWALGFTGLMLLGHIFRLIAGKYYEGRYQMTIRKFLEFQAIGLDDLKAPKAPEVPGFKVAANHRQDGQDGPYL